MGAALFGRGLLAEQGRGEQEPLECFPPCDGS
jgi:hypothetical protein